MSRVSLCGFEGQAVAVDSFGGTNVVSGSAYTYVAGRWGGNAGQFAKVNGSQTSFQFGNGGGNSGYGCRFYFQPVTNPSGGPVCLLGNFAGGLGVFWETSGALSLAKATNATPPVLSDKVTSSACTDTSHWYLVEIVRDGSFLASLYVDGVLVGTQGTSYVLNQFIGETVATTFTGTFKLDDIVFTNGETTQVGPGRVLLLPPVSDNARVGWTTNAAGTTSLFDSVNNFPPVGVASSSSPATAQIKDPATSATDNYDANIQDYTTAGITAAETVKSVAGFVVTGEEIATGTKAGALLVVSNPSSGSETTFAAYGNDAGAQGTFPSNWFPFVTGIVDAPSVTRETSPVLRIGKRTATNRVVDCCAMGLVVEVLTPAVFIPGPPVAILQAVRRSSVW